MRKGEYIEESTRIQLCLTGEQKEGRKVSDLWVVRGSEIKTALRAWSNNYHRLLTLINELQHPFVIMGASRGEYYCKCHSKLSRNIGLRINLGALNSYL